MLGRACTGYPHYADMSGHDLKPSEAINDVKHCLFEESALTGCPPYERLALYFESYYTSIDCLGRSITCRSEEKSLRLMSVLRGVSVALWKIKHIK